MLLELIAEATGDDRGISSSSSESIAWRYEPKVDPETHTQRLRYLWRWTSSSGLTR